MPSVVARSASSLPGMPAWPGTRTQAKRLSCATAAKRNLSLDARSSLAVTLPAKLTTSTVCDASGLM
eukprot:3879080-Heterocapsa_arctica.AAC.2